VFIPSFSLHFPHVLIFLFHPLFSVVKRRSLIPSLLGSDRLTTDRGFSPLLFFYSLSYPSHSKRGGLFRPFSWILFGLTRRSSLPAFGPLVLSHLALELLACLFSLPRTAHDFPEEGAKRGYYPFPGRAKRPLTSFSLRPQSIFPYPAHPPL